MNYKEVNKKNASEQIIAAKESNNYNIRLNLITKEIENHWTKDQNMIMNEQRVLDIGCREMQLKKLLNSNYYIYKGVDMFNFGQDKVLDITKQKLPYKDYEFDAVVMSEVLEHLTSHELVMREAHRVLNKDGIIIITVPNLHRIDLSLLRQFTKAEERRQGVHICGFGEYELNNLLRMFNFKPVKIRRFYNHKGSIKLPEWRIFGGFAEWIIAVAKKV